MTYPFCSISHFLNPVPCTDNCTHSTGWSNISHLGAHPPADGASWTSFALAMHEATSLHTTVACDIAASNSVWSCMLRVVRVMVLTTFSRPVTTLMEAPVLSATGLPSVWKALRCQLLTTIPLRLHILCTYVLYVTQAHVRIVLL